MAEMQQSKAEKTDDTLAPIPSTPSRTTFSSAADLEDDKERAISRAALSIAELGTLGCASTKYFADRNIQ